MPRQLARKRPAAARRTEIVATCTPDAVFPAASEPVMVYGGAVAAGAFAGQDVVFLGRQLEPGVEAYLGIALAGSIGYTLGSMGGWWI